MASVSCRGGPLGHGFLSGHITSQTTFDSKADLRAGFPRFTPESLIANHPLIDPIYRIAANEGAKPTQIALAWVLAQKPWIVPIPGTSKLNHLADVCTIDALADLKEIDEVLIHIEVHCMNPAQMELVEP